MRLRRGLNGKIFHVLAPAVEVMAQFGFAESYRRTRSEEHVAGWILTGMAMGAQTLVSLGPRMFHLGDDQPVTVSRHRVMARAAVGGFSAMVSVNILGQGAVFRAVTTALPCALSMLCGLRVYADSRRAALRCSALSADTARANVKRSLWRTFSVRGAYIAGVGALSTCGVHIHRTGPDYRGPWTDPVFVGIFLGLLTLADSAALLADTCFAELPPLVEAAAVSMPPTDAQTAPVSGAAEGSPTEPDERLRLFPCDDYMPYPLERRHSV